MLVCWGVSSIEYTNGKIYLAIWTYIHISIYIYTFGNLEKYILQFSKELDGEESQIGAGLLGRVVLSSIKRGGRVATARRTQQALLLCKQLQ